MINKKGMSGWAVFWIIVAIIILITAIGLIGGYFKMAKNAISAENYKKNYQWFKDQESAIMQIQAQICAGQMQIADFKNTFGNDTSKWSSDTVKQYGDLTFGYNGYISKYNSLVADYNAHRSDWIRSFGIGDAPVEYAEFYPAKCNT